MHGGYSQVSRKEKCSEAWSLQLGGALEQALKGGWPAVKWAPCEYSHRTGSSSLPRPVSWGLLGHRRWGEKHHPWLQILDEFHSNFQYN